MALLPTPYVGDSAFPAADLEKKDLGTSYLEVVIELMFMVFQEQALGNGS